MGPVSASVPIDAPRERVFESLCDLAMRPAFLRPFVSEYRLQRLDSTGAGATARFRIAQDGTWVETVITELDPPHRILERGRAGRLGRIPVYTAWELTEGVGPGSCEVTVTYWTEPPTLIDRLRDHKPGAARFYRRSWLGALRRLRELLEGDAEIRRVAVAGGDRIPGAG
jgi:uncharacterized protein YndB with AHSA1/START domain